jgi:hypothetical protein
MSVGAKMVVVGEAGVEHGVTLALCHGLVFAFVVVTQTDVFHDPYSWSFPKFVFLKIFFLHST